MNDYELIRENVEYILKKTEEQVNKKIKKNVREMYWKIGFEFRDLDEAELRRVVKKLSKDLQVFPDLLIDSYRFYLCFPMYKKAMRCAK